MRVRRLLLLALLTMTALVPSIAAAVTPEPSPSPSVTDSRTVLPPYEYREGQPIRQPRTRMDRIVSTIAPIAMVVVMVAGLYVYWLIRKGI
ncbi:MAG TPA: hypothetical protein VHJ78_06400 [Actinomycetota bacterium]|nr:hypothetical protein [Actinomycetota bacterium]